MKIEVDDDELLMICRALNREAKECRELADVSVEMGYGGDGLFDRSLAFSGLEARLSQIRTQHAN